MITKSLSRLLGSWLGRSLGLEPGELPRAAPFFVVYLLLFTALTIADGVAVSLFASRIGADRLPGWYSITAVLSLVLITAYLTQATRHSGGRVFGWILAAIGVMLMTAWGVYRWRGGTAPLGMLFVTREIALTMVLMHFGTFLQDYFLRNELNRILPIIYAGGRVGGIVGGGMLGWLAERIGTIQLVPVVVGLMAAAWAAILWIGVFVAMRDEGDEPRVAPGEASGGAAMGVPMPGQTPCLMPGQTAATTDDPVASRRRSVRQFLGQVVTIPLLRWLTATTILFITCRWFLAYQYTSFFETNFEDDVALAGFLGRYTQVALCVSLVLQLFVINRLVGWLGVSTTHTVYSVMVMGGLLGNLVFIGLPMAMASRFIESELRFGLRNPVNQMMVNRFTKKMRIVVRGWSLGWLIPAGTLIASAMIAGLLRMSGPVAVSVVGGGLGIAFVATAIRVGRAYDDFESSKV